MNVYVLPERDGWASVAGGNVCTTVFIIISPGFHGSVIFYRPPIAEINVCKSAWSIPAPYYLIWFGFFLSLKISSLFSAEKELRFWDFRIKLFSWLPSKINAYNPFKFALFLFILFCLQTKLLMLVKGCWSFL